MAIYNQYRPTSSSASGLEQLASFKGKYTNYSALPLTGNAVGDIALTENPQGVWFTANRRPASYYYWTGLDWRGTVNKLTSITSLTSNAPTEVLSASTGALIQTAIDAKVYGTNIRQSKVPALNVTASPHDDWVTLLDTATGVLEVGEYELILSYMFNHNATNSDFESALTFDGSVLGSGLGNAVTHKAEIKDAAGGGNASGSTQQYPFNKTFPITVASTSTKDIDFKFRSDDADDASSVWDLYIKLMRVA